MNMSKENNKELSQRIDRLFGLIQQLPKSTKLKSKSVTEEKSDTPDAATGPTGKTSGRHHELLMLRSKVDRLEQATVHIAQENGVKLSFDL